MYGLTAEDVWSYHKKMYGLIESGVWSIKAKRRDIWSKTLRRLRQNASTFLGERVKGRWKLSFHPFLLEFSMLSVGDGSERKLCLFR